MRTIDARVLGGALLVGFGVLFFLQSLGWLQGLGSGFMWGILFAAAGFLFLYVFLRDRQQWWAIIPVGVVAATAVIALLANIVPAVETTALLLLGVGLTFLVLYFLPEGRGRQPWAIIPGGILIVIGALTGIAFGTMARFFWPLVFILGGLVLVLRSRKSTPSV